MDVVAAYYMQYQYDVMCCWVRRLTSGGTGANNVITLPSRITAAAASFFFDWDWDSGFSLRRDVRGAIDGPALLGDLPSISLVLVSDGDEKERRFKV